MTYFPDVCSLVHPPPASIPRLPLPTRGAAHRRRAWRPLRSDGQSSARFHGAGLGGFGEADQCRGGGFSPEKWEDSASKYRSTLVDHLT